MFGICPSAESTVCNSSCWWIGRSHPKIHRPLHVYKNDKRIRCESAIIIWELETDLPRDEREQLLATYSAKALESFHGASGESQWIHCDSQWIRRATKGMMSKNLRQNWNSVISYYLFTSLKRRRPNLSAAAEVSYTEKRI